MSLLAWVAELVDARDLKSLGPQGCAGSIPAPGTNQKIFNKGIVYGPRIPFNRQPPGNPKCTDKGSG